MKYLHYDDRGYYTKTQQIQERVEKKALLKFHRFKKESTNKGISRIHSQRIISSAKQNSPITIPKLQQKDDRDVWELQDQSRIKNSSVKSDSKLLRQNSKSGRHFRKMEKQEKVTLDKQKINSRLDQYQMEFNQPLQLKSKSQILEVNSISKPQNSSFIPTISRVGLDSKISEMQERKFKLQQIQKEEKKFQPFSSDYEAIKVLEREAQRSVVKLLMQSRKSESSQRQEIKESILDEKTLKQKSKKISNLSQDSQMSQLSNMIKDSGRIFQNQRKKFNEFSKKQVQTKKNTRMRETAGNQSRIIFNQSKLSQSHEWSPEGTSPRVYFKDSNLREIESSHSRQLQIQGGIKKQHSYLIDLESKDESQEKKKKMKPYQTSQVFSLTNSIGQWRSYEQKTLYPTLSQTISQRMEISSIVERIYSHLDIINQIIQFVQMSAQVYQQQQEWICQQSFLIYKRFLFERNQILASLQAPPSRFSHREAEITETILDSHRNNPLIIEIAEQLSYSNELIGQSLKDFCNHLKKSDSELKMTHKNKEVGEIVKALNEQFLVLKQKIQEEEEEYSEQDNGKDIIYLRSFKIMELAFLLSELEGRKVKNLERDIEDEDFQIYFSQYEGRFKETVLFFN